MAAANRQVQDFNSHVGDDFYDARLTEPEETKKIIENLLLSFLSDVANGKNPSMELISRSGGNVLRDRDGTVHLGKAKTVKRLFSNSGAGSKSFVKIWQVLSLIYQLLDEGKVVTQREAYYCLVQQFKNQNEFNSILQDVVALTQCARRSLGICASGSGYIAGLVLWKEDGAVPYDCSVSESGKQIPGIVDKLTFAALGARYILVVEKDAIFNNLCRQKFWETLPCVIITGCGYPPLSVRAVTRKLSESLQVPVLGLFDYNPHGMGILLTYKFGSTRMGTESHAFAVDVKWLGVHYYDIFDSTNDSCKVTEDVLQPWSPSDEKTYSGLCTALKEYVNPFYHRELRLMQKRVKAEIEAIPSLKETILHKIHNKIYY